MNFVHLHNHTEYSLLDGAARINDLVSRVAEYGMPACAITDHGVMYGAIAFYQACKSQGVKPIIGCEVYVAGDRLSRSGRKGDNACHLVLLAENMTGYQNLCKLVSLGFLEGFYYKPRVDRELLEKYHEGIICLSACIAGELPELLMTGQLKEARELAADYQRLFGRDNYFIELQNHGLPEELRVLPQLVQIARDLDIPLVATNDLHYVDAGDAEMHDILLCIQTGKLRKDENRMRFPNDQFYLKTEQEMARLFPDLPEALENTLKIAERCQVDFEFGQLYMPDYQVPDGYDLESYLRFLCEKGLAEHYAEITDELRERMEYELGVINRLNFPGYFLIVWDMINFARSQGISVGPGRGSAAGSLVAYCLGITDIDPIRWGLLFERFLNPERVSPPDIDTDISDVRRGEVVDYLVKKYGEDKVSQIVTFNFLLIKGAVKSVGRVLDIPYADADRIVKLIPDDPDVKSIGDAISKSPELKAEYDSNPVARELLDIAEKIRGVPSHCGKHAAGVAIAQRELISYMPVQRDNKDGSVTTQYAKEQVEMCGLVKMDLLGLRTLSVIDDALENISKSRGISIELSKLPLDDEATFQMLSEGDTSGVFQLESEGMRKYLRDLRPDRFEDIIAMNALYRPGPLEGHMVDVFITGRHGKKTKIIHELLEPILAETYGVIVYQEQVMEVVRQLGGFSLGAADVLRRAMGKKKPEIIDKAREDFISGCAGNGLDNKTADVLFELLKKFGGYGFNKSHSAAYAMVSYQTAWLKAHYTPEFMAATMTSIMSAADKIPPYIDYCRSRGIEVLPPDINESGEKFNVVGGKIRFAMSAVKNVGREAVRQIVSEREENGPYTSLANFCERQMLNRRMLESLIRCGALDSLGTNRATMLASIDRCLDISKKLAADKEDNQISLFDCGLIDSSMTAEVQLIECEEYSFRERLEMEKEMLGFYISGHPFSAFAGLFKGKKGIRLEQLAELEHGSEVCCMGVILAVSRRFTKQGQQMASFNLEDDRIAVRCIVFPRDYEGLRERIAEGRAVLVKGKLRNNGGEPELSVSDLQPPCKIYLRLSQSGDSAELRAAQALLAAHPGFITAEAYFADDKVYAPFPGILGVDLDKSLLDSLKSLLGETNVVVK